MTLREISKPVAEELVRFQDVFRDAMRSDVFLLDTVIRYVLRQKGKRVRPLLVLLSAAAAGGVTDATYVAATLVELLHTATLVHDDVVDQADMRRGLPSVNAVWKNKISVLLGDFLLARGLLVAMENNRPEFLALTSDAVRRMSEGELLQIQRTRKLDLDEPAYLRIVSDKTASLLATCCELGGASVSVDADVRRRLRDYGEAVGVAFQIRDDLLDFNGKTSLTGKRAGMDIKQKKLTLPLIYSLGQAPKSEAREMLRIIRNGATRRDISAVTAFVEERGGIEYADRRAREFSDSACAAIEPFPDSPAKEALRAFAVFVTRRSS